MFTGIVEELGTVRGVHPVGGGARIEIAATQVLADTAIGASIAVNGCCLTVVELGEGCFAADAVTETLRRTCLGALTAGDPVNLERPVRLEDRLGGHLVQGHVDAVGTLRARDPNADGSQRVEFGAPDAVLRYVVEKGSITVDGVSLTVAEVLDDGFAVAVIPHTLAVTTLGEARTNLNPRFVKPPNDKSFPAAVCRGPDLPREFPDEMPVLSAEVVEWAIEFRCFILDRQMRTFSVYLRDGVLQKENGYESTEAEDAEVREFVGRMLADPSLGLDGRGVVMSPTSIEMALAMARAGARGTTASEMDDLLGLDGWDGGARTLSALDARLRSRDATWEDGGGTPRSFAFRMANMGFGQDGAPIEPGYLERIADAFGIFGPPERCGERLLQAREEAGVEEVFLFPAHDLAGGYAIPEAEVAAFERVIRPRLG